MAYWLVYERCEGCECESCLQCHREERSLTLHVVESPREPPNSINGPCATPDEILKRMSQYFQFDGSGKMIFKVRP